MDDDQDGIISDQFGWRDSEGNSLMLQRRTPIDPDERREYLQGERFAESELFEGYRMPVRAELVCVGEPPVEIPVEEAERLALELDLSFFPNLRDGGELAMQHVNIFENGFEIASHLYHVNTEHHPLHRACDEDRSIPMG